MILTFLTAFSHDVGGQEISMVDEWNELRLESWTLSGGYVDYVPGRAVEKFS